jgi:two-component system, NarL family, nitrate/nitrite response regulator NarL
MGKIKLFILDDHQMLIDGIKALLYNETDFTLVGEATKGALALELIKKNIPNIVLSDINMPEMDGIAFTRALKKNHPEIKILALSMFGERSTISEMLEAGASGYILKNTGKNELMNALRKIAEGGMFFSDEIAAEMMKPVAPPQKKEGENNVYFTVREKEIIQLIAKEYSNSQIGEALFISERTVETHRKNIFKKANTKTAIGLMKFAMEHHLID